MVPSIPSPNFPRVHAITNDEVLRDPSMESTAQILLDLGTAVHLRAATVGARRIADLTSKLSRPGVSLFVNDRVDIAASFKTAGVHLPSSGIPIARARELVGTGVLIGKSTHSPAEAAEALAGGADYVFFGPVWETTSHPGWAGLGPTALEVASRSGRVIAIGGINVLRSKICAESGAYGVAAITGIWHQTNPGRVVEDMLLSFTDND